MNVKLTGSYSIDNTENPMSTVNQPSHLGHDLGALNLHISLTVRKIGMLCRHVVS